MRHNDLMTSEFINTIVNNLDRKGKEHASRDEGKDHQDM